MEKKNYDTKVFKKADRKLVFLTALITTTGVGLSYIFLTWSVGFTSSVDFCTVNCHEMAVSYREWRTSSHYNNNVGVVAECSDCHLPTGFFPKIKAKIYFGIRDSWVHYFGDPENLDRAELAKQARESILDESCMACHKNLFPSGLPRGGFLAHSRVLEEGEEKKCVECHRQLVHQNRIYFGSG